MPLSVLAETPVPTRTASADLDADGKPESITLDVKDSTFVLSAGKARAEGRFEGPVKGFTVVDLASDDPRREVLLQGQGAGGVPAYRLFRLTGGALQELALPPGQPGISGNRILLADVPMAFWVRRDKYLYDAAKPGFTEVPQPLYFVGKGVVPEQPLKLLVSREGNSVVTEVAAKTPVVVLAFSPAPDAARDDDSQGWYVVLTRQHLLGWVRRTALGATPLVQDTPDFPFIKSGAFHEETELKELVSSLEADLNGDGQAETLRIEKLPEKAHAPSRNSDEAACWQDDNSFKVSIGKASLKTDSGPCLAVSYAGIVDLDTRDPLKELVVVAEGRPSLENQYFLFRWTGQALEPAFRPWPGPDQLGAFPGNGTVLFDADGLRWRSMERWVYDAQQNKLLSPPQEWTYIGWNHTVKQSFALSFAPAKGSAVVANVRVGSTVTLLARAEVGATEKKPHRVSGSNAAPRGGEIWLLFKSETGLVGWVLDKGLKLEPSLG
ncbi:hypothetical protein JRI60_05475 [Archangium violaceum]|uniref:hypothetical protein n=1 Tax=Archangium violaceum TaxID=83451 RepID=UPI0019509485|nr:hypothetical protein [Archangium violaceum]QRN98502.1 hypothetical protein JRI60_05475 [Archangium violaceum]